MFDIEDFVWVDKREVLNISELVGSLEYLRLFSENVGWMYECLEKETSVESRAFSMRTFVISDGEVMVWADSVMSSAECLKSNRIFDKL